MSVSGLELSTLGIDAGDDLLITRKVRVRGVLTSKAERYPSVVTESDEVIWLGNPDIERVQVLSVDK